MGDIMLPPPLPRPFPASVPKAAYLDCRVATHHSTREGCGVRIYFDHQSKFRLFGANQLQVVVSVLFTELEQTIIDQYDLHPATARPKRCNI